MCGCILWEFYFSVLRTSTLCSQWQDWSFSSPAASPPFPMYSTIWLFFSSYVQPFLLGWCGTSMLFNFYLPDDYRCWIFFVFIDKLYWSSKILTTYVLSSSAFPTLSYSLMFTIFSDLFLFYCLFSFLTPIACNLALLNLRQLVILFFIFETIFAFFVIFLCLGQLTLTSFLYVFLKF